MDSILLYYLKLFKSLRRDYSYGGAPHKPILLLSIIQQIQKGLIYSNRIAITPELVLEFKSNWQKLVETPHIENFSLPFFHMKSESFWRLVSKPGVEISKTSSGSVKSLMSLRNSIEFAEIDKDLFDLIKEASSRNILEEELLITYFKNTMNSYHSIGYDISGHIEKQILTEESVEYTSKINELRETLSKDHFEEEIFIRGGVFKKEIPRIYKYQCAVSGMRIETSVNAQLVDACHIVPFAISNDDTISNGISLSPNIHRAFDRGLLTFNDKFQVRISPVIKENNSPFSLKQFEGQSIILPDNPNFYPSLEKIAWHRKEVFVM